MSRLTAYDGSGSVALLCVDEVEVVVSTVLLSSFHCRIGQWVQVIGEVEWKTSGQSGREGDGEVHIVARVYRGLEEWDMPLYERVMERKRAFEQKMGLS